MSGMQVENLLTLMESAPINKEKARREITDYLMAHMKEVAAELRHTGEAVIPTSSGSFRLTEADLAAA